MDNRNDELRRLRDRVEQLEELLGLQSRLTRRIDGLTGVPRRVLGVLLACSPRVATRRFIIEACWEEVSHDQIVDANVARLRRAGIRIETMHGFGYLVTAEEKKRLENEYG